MSRSLKTNWRQLRKTGQKEPVGLKDGKDWGTGQGKRTAISKGASKADKSNETNPIKILKADPVMGHG